MDDAALTEPNTVAPPRKWEAAFLRVLGKRGNVSAACRAAKVSRVTAYEYKAESPAFATAWGDALEAAIDRLEGIAWMRAEKESDGLMSLLLKAHRPAKYRETTRHELSGPDGGPIPTAVTHVTIAPPLPRPDGDA